MTNHPQQQDDTRARIIQAAEALFSESGFANTSLRAITARAEVNLAAVNYHFGSKEALIQEIFSRRLTPLNQERLARLAALQAKTDTPSVEQLLEAYLAPTLKSESSATPGELRFMRLLGRTELGASTPLRQFVQSLYAEALDKYAIALSKTLPEIPRKELFWRLQFLIGAVAYSLSATDTVNLFSNCQLDAIGDNQALLNRLIPFLAAGLRAPLPSFK